MSIEIDGIEYHTVSDLVEELGVSRQTLWRWRQAEKIPQGHAFRDRWVVFSPLEVEEIRAYAFQLKPVGEESEDHQISLFAQRSGGSPR